jgi:hypothetical protein
MTEPMKIEARGDIEPVPDVSGRPVPRGWTDWLVLFLRAMSIVIMLKGLYHWSVVCGFIGPRDGFLDMSTPAQTATVFFAIIDLVAAVGLWLAAPWGAVVWLTSSVSMVVIDVFFPQIYGETILLVIVEMLLILAYLFLAIMAAREHPP